MNPVFKSVKKTDFNKSVVPLCCRTQPCELILIDDARNKKIIKNTEFFKITSSFTLPKYNEKGGQIVPLNIKKLLFCVIILLLVIQDSLKLQSEILFKCHLLNVHSSAALPDSICATKAASWLLSFLVNPAFGGTNPLKRNRMLALKSLQVRSARTDAEGVIRSTNKKADFRPPFYLGVQLWII